MKKLTRAEIERHRTFWAKVAKQHGWYSEPFHVVVWVDTDNRCVDSVSHRGLGRDIIAEI